MRSWLLNSIAKDLYDNFLYASSAHELWTVLQTRYGDNNGVLFYLRKETCNIKQGNLTVSQYFTKIQHLQDELSSLKPFPSCSGETAKALKDYIMSMRLLRFLMGLNEIYEHVRS